MTDRIRIDGVEVEVPSGHVVRTGMVVITRTVTADRERIVIVNDGVTPAWVESPTIPGMPFLLDPGAILDWRRHPPPA